MNNRPDEEMDQQIIENAAAILQHWCHKEAKDNGWWMSIETGLDMTGKRNMGELLCLVHSEVSEAMEGHRKNKMDNHLPHRPMLEVELADAVIRILDIAGGYNLDVPGAIVEKLEYNAQRDDHKMDNRREDGGKKF